MRKSLLAPPYCAAAAALVLLAVALPSADGNRRGGGGIFNTTSPVKEEKREGKFLFPVFQLVKFKNEICQGSGSRNGTCYTKEECSDKGGTSSGSCAAGYGVCCVFTLSCGDSSNENCTHIVQSSTSSLSGACTYKICPCNSNICRIRLDFTTFSIANPQVGTANDAGALANFVAGAANVGGGIGDCITDTFTLSSPGGVGSPVICGFNTGQHMIVDASDQCNVANFGLGATTTTSREWDIKVTQYACGDEMSGPDGCLQYFTGTTGRISSFNFPTTSTTVAAATTHLSNQCYNICIRREAAYCSICYTTAIVANAINTIDTAAAQTSFGLSASASAPAAQAVHDASCTGDYLIIPNGENAPLAANMFPAGINRYCGRTFTSVNNGIVAGVSVCSRTSPFVITFKTDADEVTTQAGTAAVTGANAAAANPMANNNEQNLAPAGIVGFSLNYVQQTC